MKIFNCSFDYGDKSKKLNKIWEFSIGNCHAYTLLRSDLREQLKIAHEECGFKYIRFHGIFMDQMNVVFRRYDNSLEFSFFNIDNIYDYILSLGMKPFVELSFMPEDMASLKSYVFRYKGNISLPKDMNEWNLLIETFVKHLIDRYGLDEIRTWFFEVWNEPNLGGDIENLNTGFFSGTQNDYFELYKNTALTIKKVDKELKVGGPATSNNRWIPEFIDFCEKNNVPLDYISTHHYPTDVIFGDNCQGGEEFKKLSAYVEKAKDKAKAWEKLNNFKTGLWKYVPKDATLKMTLKARSEAKKYPLYYTEQSSLSREDTEDAFGASYIVETNLEKMDLVLGYSYWCLSDIFEEHFQQSKEMHGGFGLITYHGIKKTPFNAYKLLHQINGEILEKNFNDDSLTIRLIKDKDADYVLLCNYDSLAARVGVFKGSIKIEGYNENIKGVKVFKIDKNHSNPHYFYKKMKNQDYLTKDEISYLKKKGELYKRKFNDYKILNNSLEINYKISGQAVILFKIEK